MAKFDSQLYYIKKFLRDRRMTSLLQKDKKHAAFGSVCEEVSRDI